MHATPAVLLAAVLGTALPLAAAGPQMRSGQWEFTTTASGRFLPQPRHETETRCITDEKIDPVQEMTKHSKCSVGEQSRSGDTVTWTMTCQPEADGPSMTGEGRITADGTTLDGQMTTTMAMGGPPQEFMKFVWKGRRLGDCP